MLPSAFTLLFGLALIAASPWSTSKVFAFGFGAIFAFLGGMDLLRQWLRRRSADNLLVSRVEHVGATLAGALIGCFFVAVLVTQERTTLNCTIAGGAAMFAAVWVAISIRGFPRVKAPAARQKV